MQGRTAPLTAKLVDSLYVEAMVLADEARSYFDGFGRNTRDGLEPLQRVGFSCESLRVTTRLMHSVAWLLSQRAIATGDMRHNVASSRLGKAMASDPAIVATLPEEARQVIGASEDLYERIARIDVRMGEARMGDPPISPARKMFEDLVQAF
jgi:regulator of CtrA degradation